jgi:hypothetical protein
LEEARRDGANRLHIGLYTRGDGQRLAIEDDSSVIRDQIILPPDSP